MSPAATDTDFATIKVPSRLVALFEGDELPRWALEAVLVEANRLHLASSGFLRDVLDMEIGEADALLASRGVYLDYSDDELGEMIENAKPRK